MVLFKSCPGAGGGLPRVLDQHDFRIVLGKSVGDVLLLVCDVLPLYGLRFRRSDGYCAVALAGPLLG